jgi:hypothetical protein
VQLAPDEIELTEDSDLFMLFRGQMSQARGHDESKTKSGRMSAVWGERQRLARESGERVTTRLPAWLEVRGSHIAKMPNGRAKVMGGTVHLIPARAKVIREIFRLAIEGRGLALIVKHLTAKGVEPWGRGGSWNKAYVYKILTGRTVLGEYQPMKDDKPNGDAIPDYFPTVVDADTWARAQSAISQRSDKPGRIGKKSLSLFSGLLYVAGTTSDRMLVSNQTRGVKGKRSKRRVLVSAGSMDGRAPSVSFPLDVFEPAILSRLEEIDPAAVLGGEPEGESATLAAELARVKQSMEAIVADLETHGDSPAILKRLREKEELHAQTAKRLAEARVTEKHPKAASLAEAQTLIDAASDESTRLRLRQLLRDAIEGVWVLVVPCSSGRMAAVQIRFAGGATRDYLIHYKPARRGVAGGWSMLTTTLPRLDFRKHADAVKVAALLGRLEM